METPAKEAFLQADYYWFLTEFDILSLEINFLLTRDANCQR